MNTRVGQYIRGIGLLLLLVLPFAVLAQSGSTVISHDVTFSEDLTVLGALSKGSGTFVIDHPLDPENKLLFHSFVESPDVKNIYDGIAVLDDSGEVTISLPSYFLVLNKDFRYQASPIGSSAPNLYVKKEIKKRFFGLFGNAVFTIAGGNSGQRISWQVTGIRHDPFILENPIEVEVEKGPDALVDKGEFLFPELYSDQ